jgi:hypothetical protein
MMGKPDQAAGTGPVTAPDMARSRDATADRADPAFNTELTKSGRRPRGRLLRSRDVRQLLDLGESAMQALMNSPHAPPAFKRPGISSRWYFWHGEVLDYLEASPPAASAAPVAPSVAAEVAELLQVALAKLQAVRAAPEESEAAPAKPARAKVTA